MKREIIREKIEKLLNQSLSDFDNAIVVTQKSKHTLTVYFCEKISIIEIDIKYRHWEFLSPIFSQNDYYVFEGRGWLNRMVEDIVEQLKIQNVNGISYLEYILQMKRFVKDLTQIHKKVSPTKAYFSLTAKDGRTYSVHFGIARVFISSCSSIFSFFDNFENSELVEEIRQLLVFNINILPAISFSYLLADEIA